MFFFRFSLSGYLPNGIHAVEAMLAAASIGAIWSSTSVDFGVNVGIWLIDSYMFYLMFSFSSFVFVIITVSVVVHKQV